MNEEHRLLDDEEEMFFLEEIDLADETELRRLVSLVDEVLGYRRGVRVSVLSAEQWQTALERVLSAKVRRSLMPHLHVLRDPRDPSHLLVGPSALSGINEHSRQITAEVVYAIIRADHSTLAPLFDRGSADLLASIVAERIDLALFTSNYPAEARLCGILIDVLRAEFGFSLPEWVAVMRRNPDRFTLALRRSRFAAFWLERARAQQPIADAIAGASRKRSALIGLLCAPEREVGDPIIRSCLEALIEFIHAGGLAPQEDGNA